jgi:hypothetical protein
MLVRLLYGKNRLSCEEGSGSADIPRREKEALMSGTQRQEIGALLSKNVTMTKTSLTRRQLAQVALAGAAGTLMGRTAAAQNTEIPPMPVPPSKTSDAGPFLAEAVPLSAGYALTPTQAREVAAALKDYPGDFGKARTYPIPAEVMPAWITTAPPTKGGRGK